MEIIIEKNKTLGRIQDEFHKRFPYLKIMFYDQSHSKGEGTPRTSTLDNRLTIGEVQKFDKSGVIEITGLMKVSELEKDFDTKYGLPIQVLRKSGKIWLQTSSTDEWTLAEQNQLAAEKNTTIEESSEPTDYHEQE